MSNLKVVQSSHQGSEEEREDMRRITYALCFQKGLPHFMLTLTPSELSNGMVAIISSGNDKHIVDDLFKSFDLDDTGTVRRTAKIQELASTDPAASATYFMEITQFVFSNLLGFDTKNHTPQEGMMGTLDWYAGSVETQRLALLHFHVIGRCKIWPALLRKLLAPDEPDPATASVASVSTAAPNDAMRLHHTSIRRCRRRHAKTTRSNWQWTLPRSNWQSTLSRTQMVLIQRKSRPSWTLWGAQRSRCSSASKHRQIQAEPYARTALIPSPLNSSLSSTRATRLNKNRMLRTVVNVQQNGLRLHCAAHA